MKIIHLTFLYGIITDYTLSFIIFLFSFLYLWNIHWSLIQAQDDEHTPMYIYKLSYHGCTLYWYQLNFSVFCVCFHTAHKYWRTHLTSKLNRTLNPVVLPIQPYHRYRDKTTYFFASFCFNSQTQTHCTLY